MFVRQFGFNSLPPHVFRSTICSSTRSSCHFCVVLSRSTKPIRRTRTGRVHPFAVRQAALIFRSRRKTWKTETKRIVIKIYCHRSLYDSFVRRSNALGLGLLHVCSNELNPACGAKRTNGKPRIGKFEFVGLWLQKSSNGKKMEGKKGMRRGLCATKNSIRFYVWFGKSVNRFASSTHYSPVEIDI